jgi:hypothetical protein
MATLVTAGYLLTLAASLSLLMPLLLCAQQLKVELQIQAPGLLSIQLKALMQRPRSILACPRLIVSAGWRVAPGASLLCLLMLLSLCAEQLRFKCGFRSMLLNCSQSTSNFGV